MDVHDNDVTLDALGPPLALLALLALLAFHRRIEVNPLRRPVTIVFEIYR